VKGGYELQFGKFDNVAVDNVAVDNVAAALTVKSGPIYFIGTIKPNIFLYTFPMSFSSPQAANKMLYTIYTTLNKTSVTAVTYTQGSGGITIIGTYLLS
jgi:hypothetical protein